MMLKGMCVCVNMYMCMNMYMNMYMYVYVYIKGDHGPGRARPSLIQAAL